MYVQNVRIFAALDKAAEVRSLLEEAVRNSPTDVLNSLSVSILGELGIFVVTTLHEDLAAYEKVRDRNQADSSFRASVAKLSTTIRQPFVVTLRDIVVGAATPAGTRPTPRYTNHSKFYPASGHVGEMAGYLEDFAKAQQADGRPLYRMTRRLPYGASGPDFTIGDSYQTVAEAEDSRKGKKGIPELFANLAGKMRALVSDELREIIVPFRA